MTFFLRCTALFFFSSGFIFSDSKAQTNIAIGKTAFSSSNENGGLGPANAVDGNSTTTRWSSASADNQWIYVDLGQVYSLTEVKLFWEAALGKDFDIEISNDGGTWVTAQTVTDNTSYNNTFDMSAFSARYVRMNGLVRGTGYGFSLYEFEIYGVPGDNTPVVNLALLKPAASSSNESGAETPDFAFDGEGTNVVNGKAMNGGVEYSRWASGHTDDEWISVDLGALYDIREIRLFWEVANGQDFDIEVSDDNATWSVASSVRNNSASQYINYIPIPDIITGRYVRMHGISRNTAFGYSLYEFQVLGPNVILPILLSEFKAVKRNTVADLQWKAEIDRESSFRIQRSEDGQHFTTIGTIVSSATGTQTSIYKYTDEAPLPGINYYRLQYNEAAGSTLYSQVVVVNFTINGRFSVYPNPLNRNDALIHVRLANPVSGNLEIRLLSAAGIMVEKQQYTAANESSFLFKRQLSLTAGTYIIQVFTKGNTLLKTIMIK